MRSLAISLSLARHKCRDTSEEYVLQVNNSTNLRTESAKEREPEVADGEREVFVEKVPQELAHAVVGPAAMHQQQSLQEAELRDGVVRREHRLHALLPRDAHAYVRRWNTHRVT